MANEDDVWKYSTDEGTLQVHCIGRLVRFYTDCGIWADIALPKNKAIELRDFLTAKLEAENE